MQPYPNRSIRRSEWFALLLILLFAAVLRLGAPGISEFKRDEANLSQLALDMARGRSFPLTGIGSSVGIPNTPVSVWLTAIPYVFSSDPIVATLFIGLLNVLAVFLLWLFARRYFGTLAAFVAALLFAASPWMVIYSRKIWAQDMLALFVVATVFSGVLGFIEGLQRWQIAHVVLLAFTVQIHYAAFILIPVSGALLLIGRKNVRREFFIGVVLAILLVLPFLVGIVRAGLKSGSASGNGISLSIDGQAFYHAALTISGTEIHSLAGEQAYQQYLASVPNLFPFLNALALFTVFAAVYLFIPIHATNFPLHLWRGGRGEVLLARVVVLWLALPVILFSVRWTATYPHYMLPMLPAAFLVIGIALGKLCANKPNIRTGVIIGTVGVAIVQTGLLVALLRFVDVTPTPGGFGTPLHYLETVREGLRTTPDVVIYSDGDSTTYDETPGVWKVLLADFPSVRFVNGTRMSVIPANGTLLANAQFRPMLDQFGAQPEQTFPLRGDEPSYITFRAPADFPKDQNAVKLTIPSNGYALQNGATLIEAWTTRKENTLRLYTVWMLNRDGKNEPTLYSVFNHIEDATGKQIAQQDGAFWKLGYWRKGDRVLQWYDVPLDAAQALNGLKWNIGMYLNENGKISGVDILDAAGNPSGQIITLSF